MIQNNGLASKLRALLKAKTTPLWIAILILVGVVIYQQVMIVALLDQHALDHDTSDVYSYESRITNLEGRSNMHGSMIDDINKQIFYLRSDSAKFDWEIKQLQWQFPDLQVKPPAAKVNHELDFDANPGKVPDVKKL